MCSRPKTNTRTGEQLREQSDRAPRTFETPRHRPANHWPSACKVFLGLYSRIKGSLPEHSWHDKTKRSIGRGRGGEVKGEGGAQNEN